MLSSASVFLLMFLAGLDPALARQENFCKPLLDWTPRYDKMENLTVCRTKLEKKCEEVTSRKMCLTVTEIKCKVELFPNCTMDWSMEEGLDFEMIMKVKPLKECNKTMIPEQHNKTLYECKNVTKQHCTTIWKENEAGEKVWAGNEDDCRDVTWEECKPVKVNVTIPAPGMNCTEYPQPYLDYEVKPVTLRADSMKCEVDKRTVCKPVKKQKCGRINYTQCLEVNTTHYSLHTTHYTLHTENYTLHTEHYTHNTTHSTNSYTCVLPVRVSKSLTI